MMNKVRIILVALFSCDRQVLLNRTLFSFFSHINTYENNIYINFNFVDSGTPNRLEYVKDYFIKNIFFMNPNSYEYSYSMFWSFMHGEYVLFLEDDRPFIFNIEKSLYYPNFIEEAALLLDRIDYVKGILFKEVAFLNTKRSTITTKLGKHVFHVLLSLPYNMFYTNGPALYKVRDLLKCGYFISEQNVAKYFIRNKWYTGYTYKGLKCSALLSNKWDINNKKITLSCQGVSYHVNNNSTRSKKRNICNFYFY